MAILDKIRTFIDDDSGAVSVEWTVLTALLTIAIVSTLGTFTAGVHMVAYAVEAEINVSQAEGGGSTSGTLGG